MKTIISFIQGLGKRRKSNETNFKEKNAGQSLTGKLPESYLRLTKIRVSLDVSIPTD